MALLRSDREQSVFQDIGCYGHITAVQGLQTLKIGIFIGHHKICENLILLKVTMIAWGFFTT